jgi:hypothetical protein
MSRSKRAESRSLFRLRWTITVSEKIATEAMTAAHERIGNRFVLISNCAPQTLHPTLS